MKLSYILMVALLFIRLSVGSQSDVGRLVSSLLADTPIEEDLQELCDEIGGRVTGSKNNEKAVQWGLSKFKEAGLNAKLDPFKMPVYWNEESTKAQIHGLDFSPLMVAKYMTPPGNYMLPLLLVGKGSSAEFNKYSHEQLSNSFVLVETDLCLDIDGLFAEYAHATQVEIEAYKRNVKGIVFMSSRPQKLLYHFLTMRTSDNQMPQFVMAREDAQRCLRLLRQGLPVTIEINSKADTGNEFESNNIIAEIKGSESPEEIIIISSHIDSWALGTGANDNGCNVSMMIDIARQMKALKIKPKRTIRFVLWNGEEQGYFGSWDYTMDNLKEMDNHLMMLSIDIGSGAINGFFTNGREEMIDITDKVLEPVNRLGPFTQVNAPIVGTDNFDFMLQGVPNLVGSHQPQVYGINYHASSDTFDKVDLKQLKINSAIVAALALGYANLDETDTQKLKRHNREEVEQIFQKFNLEFTMRMFNVWEPWVNGVRGLPKN